MNLIEFNKKFPDENSCREYLRKQRTEQGIVCKKCGNPKHYWVSSIEKFQCSKCKSRTNLRAGTIMEKSKLPLLLWFTAIHLMTSTKKPFSALEMQRQLGYKFYEPIWYMMHSFPGYSGIKNIVEKHTSTIVKGKEAMKKLPWAHTVIANSKRQILGVHHFVGKHYLQNYLNEFCYKLNRRNFDSNLFDRMIIAGAADYWK